MGLWKIGLILAEVTQSTILARKCRVYYFLKF